MQIRIFNVPISLDSPAVEEVNRFLHSSRILDVRKELVNVETVPLWSFCISYIPLQGVIKDELNENKNYNIRNREKVDYKNILSEEEFHRFSVLRSIRKDIATNDAVPAYAVFTDAELAAIAKHESINKSVLLSVSGIGKKKVEKYGEQLCALFSTKMSELINEESREFKE